MGRDLAIDLGSAAVEQGQVQLTAQDSTTFRLSATGPGGEAHSDAALHVLGTPTATLSALAPTRVVSRGGTYKSDR